MTTAQSPRLAERMLARLAGSGELDPAWRDAFSSVPRHAFIPDTKYASCGSS